MEQPKVPLIRKVPSGVGATSTGYTGIYIGNGEFTDYGPLSAQSVMALSHSDCTM